MYIGMQVCMYGGYSYIKSIQLYKKAEQLENRIVENKYKVENRDRRSVNKKIKT